MKKTTFFFALIWLFLPACSNTATVSSDSLPLLANEKTMPDRFSQITLNENDRYLIEKVVTSSAFKQTWSEYGFKKKAPDVDFETDFVLFIALEESGSCPKRLEQIHLSPNGQTLTLSLESQSGACTADAVPRSFSLLLDKQQYGNVERAVIGDVQLEINMFD